MKDAEIQGFGHYASNAITAIVYLAVTGLLFSCNQRHSAPDIDPTLGFECFESHPSGKGKSWRNMTFILNKSAILADRQELKYGARCQ